MPALEIDGYPPPTTWSLVITARSDISSVQAEFDGATGVDFAANRQPVIRLGDEPVPWGDGTFRLGPVATQELRAPEHPQGVLNLHRATFFAGVDDPVARHRAWAQNLPAALAARIRPQRGNPYGSSAFGWWSLVLMSPRDLGAAAADAWIRSGADLAQKILDSVADIADFDDLVRALYDQFQILLPEGDWRQMVCCADHPDAAAPVERVISLTYDTDYTALDRDELHIGVRYLVDPSSVPSNLDVPGEYLYTPSYNDTSRPLKIVAGLQPDLQAAVAEALLQELRLLAGQRQAQAVVPAPLDAAEMQTLMPGGAVAIGERRYWITELRIDSEADNATLDLYAGGPYLDPDA